MNETEFYQATKSGALHGAYLLMGEEELTKQEAIARVEGMLDAGFRDLNRQTLQTPSPQEVLSACAQLPFFDAFRIVLVKDWDKDTADALCKNDAVLFLPESTVLLLIQRGDSKKTDSLFKLLSRQNRVVAFEKLTQDRAVNLVMREAGLKNVGISRGTASRLVDMVGLDAYRLKNEFSKAADYAGKNKEVTDEILSLVVTPTAEFAVFEMLDALLAGKKKQGIAMVEKALKEGESAMGLAAFMAGRLKLILTAREYLDGGKSPDAAARLMGGSFYAAKKAVQSAQKRTASGLREAVAAFERVDLMTRQGLAKDSEALLLGIFSQF